MFTTAFQQIKNIDLALLRPKKPTGTNAHVSFEVKFDGEYVVGETGPYKQVFDDISKEL